MDPLSIPDLDESLSGAGNTSQLGAGAHLDIAYREYERAIKDVDHQMERIFRVAAIGFSAAGVLLYLVLERDIGILSTEWSYWIAPLLLAMFYALIIQFLNNVSLGSYYITELEKVLNERSSLVTFGHQQAMAKTLYSIRSADPRSVATYIIILIFAASLYLAIVLVGYQGLLSLDGIETNQYGLRIYVDNVPDWHERAYLGFNLFVMAVLLWAGAGTMASRREVYTNRLREPESPSLTTRDNNSIVRLFRTISYAIVPRRMDLFFKPWFMVGGYVYTCLIFDVSIGTEWKNLALLLVVIEVLAMQSAYVWNDIHDMYDDDYLPTKGRYRLRGMGYGRKSAIWLFLVRASLSVYVSWIVGHELELPWLVWLVCAIFARQFIYDRWAKRRPVRRVIVSGISYGMRAAVGASVVLVAIGTTSTGYVSVVWIWASILMFAVLMQYWWGEHLFLAARLIGTPSPRSLWKLYRAEDKGRDGEYGRDWSADWFINNGERAFRGLVGLLIFVGIVLTVGFSGVDSQLHSGVKSSAEHIGSKLNGWLNWIANQLSALASWLQQLKSHDGQLPPEVLVFASLLAVSMSIVLLMLYMRFTTAKVARSAIWGNNNWTDRFLVSFAWVALLVPLWFVLPFELLLISLVPVLTVIVLNSYAFLTHLEAVDLERMLHETLAKIPMVFQRALFAPWAIRIVIVPGSGEPISAECKSWMEELQRYYLEWARTKNLNPEFMKDDGGYPLDLMIEDLKGDAEFLLKETGIHTIGSDHSRSAAVIVLPATVSVRPEMGVGLKLPDFRNKASLIPFLVKSEDSEEHLEVFQGQRFTYALDEKSRRQRGDTREVNFWSSSASWQPNRKVECLDSESC